MSLTEVERMALAESRVGRVLKGKWELERLLGQGGMATVYAGRHRNQKRGAVKVLEPEIAQVPELRARFLREGYAANQVEHPGVVSVLDDDVDDDGTVFLVMELLEGQTLAELASARGGRLDPVTAVRLVRELCDVLAAAHDKGVIHRDIKPENLFLTTRGELKVLDFGIARLVSTPSSVTATGQTFGTPAFMAPEQALGETSKIDGRTDVWAAGATLFTLLSGRFVHEADTVQKTVLAAMTRPAPRLADVCAGLPAELTRVVDRALAFEPDDRFPSASALRDALAGLSSLLEQRASAVTLDAPLDVRELAGPAATTAAARTSSTPAALETSTRDVAREPSAERPPRKRVWLAALGGLAALGVVGALALGGSQPRDEAREGSARALGASAGDARSAGGAPAMGAFTGAAASAPEVRPLSSSIAEAPELPATAAPRGSATVAPSSRPTSAPTVAPKASGTRPDDPRDHGI
jgi:tRNA A-37 threonylcarbamoyl transferase component Bud32